MKITQSCATALMILLMSSAAWYATLTVPNTFVAGTPAVAADVNANFTAVQTAVNANNNQIIANAPLKVKSNGQIIGLLLSYGNIGRSILSSKGYVFRIQTFLTNVFSLTSSTIEYSLAGCAGVKYTSLFSLDGSQGQVFKSSNTADPIQVYYVPKNSTYLTVTPASYFDANGVCQTGAAPGSFSPRVQVFANDPAVTGVQSVTTYALPVAISQ